MSRSQTTLTVVVGALAALLSSGGLLGQGVRFGQPLPIYHPPPVPLQHLHFTLLHPLHFGPPVLYGIWQTPYYTPLFFHFGYPVLRQSIIILKHVPSPNLCHHHGSPKIDFWLLALKEGPIYAVADYWLEDETLHYTRRDGTSSSVPLEDVDLTFTKRLNRRLGNPFSMRATK